MSIPISVRCTMSSMSISNTSLRCRNCGQHGHSLTCRALPPSAPAGQHIFYDIAGRWSEMSMACESHGSPHSGMGMCTSIPGSRTRGSAKRGLFLARTAHRRSSLSTTHFPSSDPRLPPIVSLLISPTSHPLFSSPLTTVYLKERCRSLLHGGQGPS